MTFLGIVGSRTFENYTFMKSFVDKWIKDNGKIIKIVSGGASGADSLARKYAIENNIPLVEHLPDYKTYGSCEPIMRNTLIIKDITHLIAFPSPNSKGTWDSINKAQKNNVSVYITSAV